MNATKILVCTHKAAEMPDDGCYMPIQAGKAVAKTDLGIAGDDTGDHISAKNPHYNELTALYWAWKNLPPEVEYVGLCHYRRYFWFDAPRCYAFPNRVTNDYADVKRCVAFTPNDIDKFLGKYDVAVAKANVMDCSINQFFGYNNPIEFFTVLRQLIVTRHPDYAESVARYWDCDNKFYPYNMFLASRSWLDGYCHWLFPLLFECEEYLRKLAPMEINRFLGLAGEIMLQLYCQHNKMKVKQIPILIYIPEEQPSVPQSVLRYRIGVSRLNTGFALSHRPIGTPKYHPYQAMIELLKNKGVEIK